MELRPPAELSFTGNMLENWTIWYQQFKIYLIASGKENESDERKINILLNLIGPAGIKVYNNFKKNENETYDDVVNNFKNFCEPSKNIILQRFKFACCIQKEGQDFDDFVTKLKQLACSCAFSEEDNMIRDRIVFGIRDNEIKDKLLHIKNLTLEEAEHFCKISEVTKKEIKKIMSTPNAVNVQVVQSSIEQTESSKKGQEDNGNSAQRKISIISLMLIGVSALVLGTLIAIFDPYRLILNWKLVMSKGDETFEMWEKPDAKVFLKVYIFNITNREEFLSGVDEKLRFQEVGPYVYRELSEHKNVTFNSNGTLSTTPVFPLQWVPELNSGKEDDVLILPNIALLSFASVMSEASLITRMAVNLLIRQTKSKPFIRQTAKEFMFGYETALVTLGNKFLPSWIAFDKLGLIDRMYDFTGDSATIFTGETDVKKSGIIDNYNRRPYLPHWPEAPCNRVSGASDGTKFPSMSPDDTTMFFRKSLCRSIPMVRVSNLTIHDGIPVYKYIFKNGSLDNGADNPENKCFCRKNKCLTSGLIDVTDCYYGFPIALSYPHFYKSDQSLVNSLDGLNPNQNLHETYFFINPETGLPVQLYVRMQINLALGDLSGMANTEHCSNLVLPLVWTEIGFEKLPENMLTKFFVYLRVGPALFLVLEYALLVGGVAFIALTVIGSLYIPVDDELRYTSAWRRESQTLTAGRDSVPTVRVPIPAAACPAKEMNTYYNSLLGGGDAMAARLNDDLCDRLDVVHEVGTSDDSCAGSSDDDDTGVDRII